MRAAIATSGGSGTKVLLCALYGLPPHPPASLIGSGRPQKSRPFSIHPSAWKSHSPNFGLRGFLEVAGYAIRTSNKWCIRTMRPGALLG